MGRSRPRIIRALWVQTKTAHHPFLVQTKTAHHDLCGRSCFAPLGALTQPRLSRSALHFARPSGYSDSGFLVRIFAKWPLLSGLMRSSLVVCR